MLKMFFIRVSLFWRFNWRGIMPTLHFAKVNINSEIFSVYQGDLKIKDILQNLYDAVNDKKEYIKVEVMSFLDEKGDLTEIDVKETFSLSDIEKFDNGAKQYITGKLVKRFPIYTEEFDATSRKTEKVVVDGAVSILFYFDVYREIVTFCERTRFGHNQFVGALQYMLNQSTDIGYEIFLIKDPFSIQERIQQAHKVTKIKATVIPPNMNEEALKALYNKNVKEMEEAGVTKKTTVFEVHKKSIKGININSKLVSEALDTNDAYRTFEVGYGKIIVDGQNKDGSGFHYDSDEHSPYRTIINEAEKNSVNLFIEASNQGIVMLLGKQMIERYKE